jgi:hypothetical protein
MYSYPQPTPFYPEMNSQIPGNMSQKLAWYWPRELFSVAKVMNFMPQYTGKRPLKV